jgi:hypothetical protein
LSDEPADTDWAFAAGFVDGEGRIAIIRGNGFFNRDYRNHP